MAADIFSSRPFNDPKQIKPDRYHCETCGYSMRSHDRGSHERGKKHQGNLALLRAKEDAARAEEAAARAAANAGPGWDGLNGDGPGADSQERSKTACHNCGQEGHKSKECTAPRSASNVECRRCHQMGHFAKDCPNGGGGRACHNCGQEGHMVKECPEPRKPKCRNCDQVGHRANECPEPKDWSRIQCNNCGEYGHGAKRCPNPAQVASGDGGWNDASAPAAGGDWANAPAEGNLDDDTGGAGDWAKETTNDDATESIGAFEAADTNENW